MQVDQHLDGDQLMAVCLGLDRTSTHLASCKACRQQYDLLSARVSANRATTVADVDSLFSAERLRRQRDHILHRLAAAGRPARILRFPRVFSPVTAARQASFRWVVTAAAAGLLIGVIAGNSFELPWRLPSLPLIRQESNLSPRHLADEEFLSSIDAVLTSTRASELQALEELTPLVREVAVNQK